MISIVICCNLTGTNQKPKVSIKPSNEKRMVESKVQKFKNKCLSFYNDNKILVLSITVFVTGAFLCITILKAVHQGKSNFCILGIIILYMV